MKVLLDGIESYSAFRKEEDGWKIARYVWNLTQADLDKASHSLNGRPRQTLDGMTPSEKLAEVLQ